MATKKHKFSHTHVEHHKDGSHTVHHVHESDPKQDVKHAVADLDGMHDSMQDHLGTPNPGEEVPPVAGAPGTAPAGGTPPAAV